MNFIEITIAEFKAKKDAKNLFLIDVREEYEFEEFNLGGINIPLSEVLSRTSEFENQREVFICCSSGKRSKTAAYHLADKLKNITFYSLQGGVKEYLTQ